MNRLDGLGSKGDGLNLAGVPFRQYAQDGSGFVDVHENVGVTSVAGQLVLVCESCFCAMTFDSIAAGLEVPTCVR